MDTSTPAGRMVFTVLGAVAELERSLIAERVKAGLRNAKAKGKTLGRPKVILDPSRIAALRAQGAGWKKISRELGIGVGTVLRIAQEARESGSKNHTHQTFRTPVRKTPRERPGASAAFAAFR
jgi:DNA invertase Pin-like site-specific DNA recombinase